MGLSVPVYGFMFEPRWFERTLTSIKLPGRDIKRPIKILHLSDLHASLYTPFSLIERAVDMGVEERPDLICLTGDYITDGADFDGREYRRVLAKLARTAPTFAVLGNHDGGGWVKRVCNGYPDTSMIRSVLADGGVKLLHNTHDVLTVRGQKLCLAGVGDLWNEELEPELAFQGHDASIPTVLLSHNPDSKDLVAGHPWDLMLCGHTHGGQVLLPVVGTRYVAVKDKEFISGLKQWDGRQIYITRGVGSLAGVRFNCRPEVSILALS